MNVTFKHPVAAGLALLTLFLLPVLFAGLHTRIGKILFTLFFIVFWISFVYAFRDPANSYRPDGTKKDLWDRL